MIGFLLSNLLVELKIVQGSSSVTVRIVQLGYDEIDVYLDGVHLWSVKLALGFVIS